MNSSPSMRSAKMPGCSHARNSSAVQSSHPAFFEMATLVGMAKSRSGSAQVKKAGPEIASRSVAL
jgi:hypothetical protein